MKLIKWLWQLPQNLIGFIFWVAIRKKILYIVSKKHAKVYIIKSRRFSFGVSLGRYIFLSQDKAYNFKSIKHEHGHSIQSLYLGPLYLVVVGLPSLTRNILTRSGLMKRENYYSGYPEKCADKLGKVER